MESYKLLINGRLVDGASTMNVVNPATEEVLAACPRASKGQLDEAVAAAKAAFPAWSKTPMVDRKRAINAIADVVETSLFADRGATADAWHKARDAYADFALAGNWR